MDTLQDLGFTEELRDFRNDKGLASYDVGRIISEHRERYNVKSTRGEFDSELLGNLRYTAESRYDLPAVGDWVAFSEYDDGKALIHAIYPRSTVLERQTVGKSSKVQIIATNIDFGLIVQSVNRDFNLNRLERYLTICNASRIAPIIVLSKIDLVNQQELKEIEMAIAERISDVSVVRVTNEDSRFGEVLPLIHKGKTYCLLGSSGVGKSTLLNYLSGGYHMKTGEISSSVNKGKHVTSHRELVVLQSGGIIIDNPGMREVGITDQTAGVEVTFESILAYAEECRYKDCTHALEKGCAVLEALAIGEINEDAYENFQKIQKEHEHYSSSAQDRRRKDKQFGKTIKNIQKERRKNKY